jgi:predicted ATPase/class 3 adenylate cyclase
MIHDLPTGAITFLFTDIEGSSALWEHHPEAMRATLARHDSLLREAIESNGGRVVKTTGDGCHAVFASPVAAVVAAVAAQRMLMIDESRYEIRDTRYEKGVTSYERQAMSEETSELDTRHSSHVTLRLRMGLHTGEAELRDNDYFGPAVNRAARIMSVAHGGQILLSAATTGLVADGLPPEMALRDLGEHRLKDLSRPSHIYQVMIDGLPANFPPLRSLDTSPGNLPVQLTSFVGREWELVEVKRLLGTTRLLTLTGPGGTGKTRLSLQAAADVQADYLHGAWLVELAPITDPGLVPGAVVALFGLSPQPGMTLTQVLADYLRGKHLLLILDNCEHLVEASAGLAADLLAVAPRLTILASSREGLGVPGETTFHVPTLALPAAEDTTAAAVCRSNAADLFLQRAQAAKPDFSVTDANAAAVAQIVRRLDGIPLAIELAAARVRVLTPEQIAERLADRFRLLTGGSRTALPRQQTLRALIDWSYDLLNEEEQWFFRQLGVFVGGWTLEAAEFLVDLSGFGNLTGLDALDLLAGLVNKSLVVVDESEYDTHYRYLETIRQYARDKLFEKGEGEAARDRHMIYFKQRIMAIEPIIDMSLIATTIIENPDLIMAVEKNLENIRAAIEWGIIRDPESALAMVSRLTMLLIGSQHNIEGLVSEALAAVDALPPATGEKGQTRVEIRCLAYQALGYSQMGFGDMVSSRMNLGWAIRLAREIDHPRYLAAALVQRALAGTIVNADDVIDDGQEAAELYRRLNMPLMAAQGMGLISLLYFRRGELEKAKPLAEETLSIVRQHAGHSSLANAMIYLSMPQLALSMGDIPLAESLYHAGIDALRRLRSRFFACVLESDLAHHLRRAGRPDDARPIYRRAIREWQDMGRRAAVANMLENFAFMARGEGQIERAARLFGAAGAIRDEIQIDMSPWEREEYDREVTALRTSMPVEEFWQAWAIGQEMKLDEAVDYAIEN